MDNNWIITLVVAIIASLPGLFALKLQRKKQSVDIAVVYEKMASEQAEDIRNLRTEILALEDKVNGLQKRLIEYEAGIALLVNQIKASGLIPIWEPKKKPKRSEAE